MYIMKEVCTSVCNTSAFKVVSKITWHFAYWKKDRICWAHRWASWIKGLQVTHRGNCTRVVRSHEIGVCTGKHVAGKEKEGVN